MVTYSIAPKIDNSVAESLLSGGNSHIALAADLNNDGRDEIILHYWTTNPNRVSDGTLEQRDTVVIYGVNDDRSIENLTEHFLGSNYVSLGAGSRDIASGDINGDGKIDFAFALNRDDQRILLPGADIDAVDAFGANSVALISNSNNEYSVVQLPAVGFFHTVSIVPNESGLADVVFSLSSGSMETLSYGFENGSPYQVGGYPQIWNNDAIYFETNGQQYIFSTMYNDPSYAQEPSLILYERVADQWSETGKIVYRPIQDPYAMSGADAEVSYGTLNQYDLGTHIAMNLVFYEVSFVNNIDGSATCLALASGDFVSKQNALDGIEIDEIEKGNFWLTLEVGDNFDLNSPSTLPNQIINLTAYFNQSIDINADGLSDFITYPRASVHSQGAEWQPCLYINNGDGLALENINIDFTNFARDYAQPRGLVGNFDNDDTPDLFLFSQNIWAWEDIMELASAPKIFFSAFDERSTDGIDHALSSETYALSADIENLTLTGNAAINGTGNTLNNVITGNSAANTLNGVTGNDTLVGGAGDDIYATDGGDTITEGSNAGTDTVQSSASATLGLNLENLTLTGSLAINGTGNTLNNILTGNSGNNILNGGTGNDTLVGGTGNDTYVTDASDTIIEASGSGTDTVQSSATYTLAANLENLTLTGSAAIAGNGNTLNNVITGNNAANTLNGGAGFDTLNGGTGKDLLIGAAGNDTFIFNNVVESAITATTADVITDFVKGQDKINLRAIDAFASSSANDTFIWKGTAAFSSKTQGEVRYQKFDNRGSTNDYTMVWIDNDADKGVEMAIRLTGLYNLSASDFVL